MSNYSKSYKVLNCRECGAPVDKVDNRATSVQCWKCVMDMMRGYKLEPGTEPENNTENCSKKS
jgi:hypothetical protein